SKTPCANSQTPPATRWRATGWSSTAAAPRADLACRPGREHDEFFFVHNETGYHKPVKITKRNQASSGACCPRPRPSAVDGGLRRDDWLDGTLQAGAHAQVITVTAGITPLKGQENGATVDDPHVWHDPDNDKIIADNIAAALDKADPNNESTYDANAAAYKKK